MKRLLIAIGIVLAVTTGCETDRPARDRPGPERTLLFGLNPEQNIFKQIERYEPLADYLGRKAGVRIGLKVLPRYGNLIDNFESAGLDGAFFGSFSYSLAHARLGVQVIARPERPDGVSTYQGMIIVRKDSGIRAAKDMKGKRLAFVARATAAGYLFPLAFMRKGGVGDVEAFFKEVYFAGTHEDVVRDVLNGKADVGACKNTVFGRLAAADPRVAKELVILDRSLAFPENALALRRGVEAPLKEKLKNVLLTMHEDPEGRNVLENFGARRFVETTDADYDVVLSYTGKIGIDLATYDYTNR